jgi:hypothetical protein
MAGDCKRFGGKAAFALWGGSKCEATRSRLTHSTISGLYGENCEIFHLRRFFFHKYLNSNDRCGTEVESLASCLVRRSENK